MPRQIQNDDLVNIETVEEAVSQKISRKIFNKEFESLKKQLKDVNYVLLTVVVILLIMVATLIIDSFHFNSATYKEYSQKTEAVEIAQESNKLLLKQIEELSEQNKQNQEMIIKQHEQIIDLLKEIQK